jgi:hypothetical protein
LSSQLDPLTAAFTKPDIREFEHGGGLVPPSIEIAEFQRSKLANSSLGQSAEIIVGRSATSPAQKAISSRIEILGRTTEKMTRKSRPTRLRTVTDL